MLTTMLISLGLPTDRLPKHPELATAASITAVSQRAEAAGYDAVFVTDHPFPSAKYVAHGGHHSIDPFVALSFAAAATTTLRLQTNLLILAYRNPFVTAQGISTLDSLSGGRTIIGVGAGYLAPEFAALGAEFAARGKRNDEVLTAMTAAWRGEPVEMEGSDFRATDNVLQPLPAQLPHPPLLIGGNSTAAIRRAVTMAQGWIPMPSPASAAKALGTPGIETLDDLGARIAIADRLAAEHGRTEPLQIWFTPWAMSGFGDKRWDPHPLLDELASLASLGVVGVTVTLPGSTLEEFLGVVDAFAEDIVQHVR
ncbi:MAG: putative F420-dependent oxidoreductase, Rv2161c family [Ilumatobacteraceae bacterium]|nr:putative F420-dependent oxidoreductase, Rv2161c family [Ilumatobacteraceae bacterium]